MGMGANLGGPRWLSKAPKSRPLALAVEPGDDVGAVEGVELVALVGAAGALEAVVGDVAGPAH